MVGAEGLEPDQQLAPSSTSKTKAGRNNGYIIRLCNTAGGAPQGLV